MARRRLEVRIERFATAAPFVIARGAKEWVDVIFVAIHEDGHVGRGEATPIYYRHETAQSVVAAIETAASFIRDGGDIADLARHLPAGAARKALDCALWDLRAKQSGQPIWHLLGCGPPHPIPTAYTISLGQVDAMAQSARAAFDRGHRLLKLKLSGQEDVARVAAVRAGAPDARIIIDANESWCLEDVEDKSRALHDLGVVLIEQPLPAGQDAGLAHVRSAIPLCADESLHDVQDLAAIAPYYDAINIKLDKSGGLTEALALAAAAKQAGLEIMTGCMLSTSLGIAPAFYIGLGSAYVDLDGPLLLADDRPYGVRYEQGMVYPPESALWG